MITRIEIDGFKSFYDFAVDLRPFQVLVGANGSGKSNLFDAIMLLSYLASEKNIVDALKRVRADRPEELFSIQKNGSRNSIMEIAVEVFIPPNPKDSLANTGKLASQYLRYSIGIEKISQGETENIHISYERLAPVASEPDTGYLFNRYHKKQNYEYTTRVSLATSIFNEDATVYAMRQEMLSWRTYSFQPNKIRQPALFGDTYSSPELAADGSNLTAVLYWLKNHENHHLEFHGISLAISALVDNIAKIDVRGFKELGRIYLEAKSPQQARLSADALSDGTLRLLALLTLVRDTRAKGVICFEEPENSVHAHHLERIMRELNRLPTTLGEPHNPEIPLRQILVSTHSPLALANVKPEDILFVYMTHRGSVRLTRMGSLIPDPEKTPSEQRVPVDLLRDYLSPEPLVKQYQQLEEIIKKILA